MLKVLVPVDGSGNCRFAVKHVIKKIMNNTAMEIHLPNVQAPFTRDIARLVSRKDLHDYRLDEVEKALGQVKQMRDGFSIPYSTHAEVGAPRHSGRCRCGACTGSGRDGLSCQASSRDRETGRRHQNTDRPRGHAPYVPCTSRLSAGASPRSFMP